MWVVIRDTHSVPERVAESKPVLLCQLFATKVKKRRSFNYIRDLAPAHDKYGNYGY